jgi:hypothetical protein
MPQAIGGLLSQLQSYIEILQSDDKMMGVFVQNILLKLPKFVA